MTAFDKAWEIVKGNYEDESSDDPEDENFKMGAAIHPEDENEGIRTCTSCGFKAPRTDFSCSGVLEGRLRCPECREFQ